MNLENEELLPSKEADQIANGKNKISIKILVILMLNLNKLQKH